MEETLSFLYTADAGSFRNPGDIARDPAWGALQDSAPQVMPQIIKRRELRPSGRAASWKGMRGFIYTGVNNDYV